MAVICVGTMAFDAIETPFGKIDKIIGGSGTYVAYAASNFIKPVQQISIVGYDFPKERDPPGGAPPARSRTVTTATAGVPRG